MLLLTMKKVGIVEITHQIPINRWKIPSLAKFIMPHPNVEGKFRLLPVILFGKPFILYVQNNICIFVCKLWTHFQSKISFCTRWSQQKICGFLILSGVIKGEHCGMEWKNVLTCLLHVCNTIKIYQKNSSFYPLAKSHLKDSPWHEQFTRKNTFIRSTYFITY